MNRLKELLDEGTQPESPTDFFEIEARHETFVVTREVAAEIERRLERLPRPRWITFRDLSGARHRVRAALITRISESTSEQREASREFRRARREENKGDRPWEDDLWY